MNSIELTLVEILPFHEPKIIGKTRFEGANGYVQKNGYTIVFFGNRQITVKETLGEIACMRGSKEFFQTEAFSL